MKDIEFASGLLLFLRHGMVEGNTKTINEAYDEFNDTYEESDVDINEIDKFLERCGDNYFEDPDFKFVFSKTGHLFTLFGVEKYLFNQGFSVDDVSKKVAEFSKLYRSGDEGDVDVLILEYRKAASFRTRSKSNRQLRMNALARYALK